MADQSRIKLYAGHATPNNIILRDLPVADAPAGTTIYLYENHATPNNIILRDPTVLDGGGPAFPTQYSGFRIQTGGGMVELCLVAEADAPSGMGGVLKIKASGATRVVYLVETTDPNASALRIRTTTGTKSIRLKT